MIDISDFYWSTASLLRSHSDLNCRLTANSHWQFRFGILQVNFQCLSLVILYFFQWFNLFITVRCVCVSWLLLLDVLLNSISYYYEALWTLALSGFSAIIAITACHTFIHPNITALISLRLIWFKLLVEHSFQEGVSTRSIILKTGLFHLYLENVRYEVTTKAAKRRYL